MGVGESWWFHEFSLVELSVPWNHWAQPWQPRASSRASGCGIRTGFGRWQACEEIPGSCCCGQGGREVQEGRTHVLGGEIQGHLCGWKIVRSWNAPLMNSLHAVEMTAIIIAYFMRLWRASAKWAWERAGLWRRGVEGGVVKGGREKGGMKYYYLKHIPRHNKALKWKYCWDSFHYACSRPHYGISRSDCAAETRQYLHWIPIM